MVGDNIGIEMTTTLLVLCALSEQAMPQCKQCAFNGFGTGELVTCEVRKNNKLFSILRFACMKSDDQVASTGKLDKSEEYMPLPRKFKRLNCLPVPRTCGNLIEFERFCPYAVCLKGTLGNSHEIQARVDQVGGKCNLTPARTLPGATAVRGRIFRGSSGIQRSLSTRSNRLVCQSSFQHRTQPSQLVHDAGSHALTLKGRKPPSVGLDSDCLNRHTRTATIFGCGALHLRSTLRSPH